jgi:hypothetical protein
MLKGAITYSDLLAKFVRLRFGWWWGLDLRCRFNIRVDGRKSVGLGSRRR